MALLVFVLHNWITPIANQAFRGTSVLQESRSKLEAWRRIGHRGEAFER